jgi:hypothetical protein
VRGRLVCRMALNFRLRQTWNVSCVPLPAVDFRAMFGWYMLSLLSSFRTILCLDEPVLGLGTLACAEWFQCCAQDCGFPVVIAPSDFGLLPLGNPASHGAVGFCTNFKHNGHVQRYCASCEMFIRCENFSRTNPSRGHAYGHPKRRANRKYVCRSPLPFT